MLYRYFTDRHYGARGGLLYIAAIPFYWLLFTGLAWLAHPYITGSVSSERIADSTMAGVYIAGFWLLFIDGPTARVLRRALLYVGAIVLSIAIPVAMVGAVYLVLVFGFGYATKSYDSFASAMRWLNSSRSGFVRVVVSLPIIVFLLTPKLYLTCYLLYDSFRSKIRGY